MRSPNSMSVAPREGLPLPADLLEAQSKDSNGDLNFVRSESPKYRFQLTPIDFQPLPNNPNITLESTYYCRCSNEETGDVIEVALCLDSKEPKSVYWQIASILEQATPEQLDSYIENTVAIKSLIAEIDERRGMIDEMNRYIKMLAKIATNEHPKP